MKRTHIRHRTDAHGDEHIEAVTEDGDVVSTSTKRTDFLGTDYLEHRNRSGDVVGRTYEADGILAGKHEVHTDRFGNKIGETHRETDTLGNRRLRHYDKSHKEVGGVREKQDLFGTKTVVATGTGPFGSAVAGAGTAASGLATGAWTGLAATGGATAGIGGLGIFLLGIPIFGVQLGLYFLIPIGIGIAVPYIVGRIFSLPRFTLHYYLCVGVLGGLGASSIASADGDPWGIGSWIVWMIAWPVGIMVAFFLDNTGRDTVTMATVLLLVAAACAAGLSVWTKRVSKA